MTHEVTFEMSDDMVRYAVNRFWLRHSGWGDLLGIILVAVACILIYQTGKVDWLAIVFLTIACIGLVVLPGGYLVYRHRALERLRQIADRKTAFRFDEGGICCETALGSSFLKWPAITRIWRFQKAWLLFVSKTSYLILPTNEMQTELTDFIVAAVRANGGKVK